MLPDVLEDLVVRPANSHIGSRIAEFFGTLRHKGVKSAEESSLKIEESIRMFNGIVLNHIEHIDLRSEYLRECNCIVRCIGSRHSKVGSKKDPLERKRL